MDHLIDALDLVAAQNFLTSLGGTKFTFMAIPEGRETGIQRSVQVLHGEFDQVAQRVGMLNITGHGIFFMVNEGDLQGRKAPNVIRVRALFVDLDGASPVPLVTSASPPRIMVNSSPSRYHGYWPVDGCPLDDFKPGQQALAKMFGGDPSVCDLPRVMRLPGFFHLKTQTPFLVQRVDPNTLRELP